MRKTSFLQACTLALLILLFPGLVASAQSAAAIGAIGGAGGPVATAAPMATPTPVPPSVDATDPAEEAAEDTAEQAAPEGETATPDGTDAAGDDSDAQGVIAVSTTGTVPAVSPSPTPEPTAAPVISDVLTLEVDIGYEGLVVMNRWSPAFVTVTNSGADFDGMLGVNVYLNQSEYDRYEMPLTLASGATKRVVLPMRPQTRQDMYAFELLTDGKIVAEKRVTPARLAAPEAVTIGLLSDAPEDLSYLQLRANNLDTLRGEAWLTVSVTPETFPETSELMDAFVMLVIDGIDVRTLTDAQQQALTSWLLAGGHLFISGGAQAATGYPFFSQWTGLAAGGLEEAPDFTQALLDYAAVKGSPVEEPIWVNAIPDAEAFISSEDGQGLLARSGAGDGVIYTAAFDMGGKPLSGWSQMSAFWPRMLRQSEATEYQALLNRLEQSRYNGNDSWRAQQIMDQLKMPNSESGIPVLVVLIAYLVLVGFGAYLLLRRFDRREWLWVAAPACAIVFALLVTLLAQGSTMNKPVTLTASRVVLDGENAQTISYLGVATPNSGELMIETDQNQLPTVITNDGYYWYDDPTAADKLYRPLKLRQRYRLGQTPAVGFIGNEAWDAKMLRINSLQREEGELAISMWMEEHGIHGEAVNNTAHTLKDSVVITAFGFSTIEDILPGQTVPFEMLLPKGGKLPQDPDDPYKVFPNVMYSTLDFDPSSSQGQYYVDSNVYTYMNAAAYRDGDYNDPDGNRRYALMQMFEEDWSYYEDRASYYFFAFNDTIGQLNVTLNDEPVTRTAHTAIIGGRVTFEPIGPTGVVMYPQGLIPGEIFIDQGEDEKPRIPTEDDQADLNNQYGTMSGNYTYVSLNGPAAVRFQLPNWGDYTVERMTLTGTSYESTPEMYLYNHKTGAWDEQLLLTAQMDGKGWAPYIDSEGQLFVRYVPPETASRYGSMPMPTITLKGVEK